jgi:hypothetical protein
MIAYASIVVGQEIDGKNLVVKIEKVSCDKSKIDGILATNKNSWVEQFDVPEGKVPMYFSRNPQEIFIEDVEHNEKA